MVELGLFLLVLLAMVVLDPATFLNGRNVFYDLKYHGFSWQHLCGAVKKYMLF
jgi:hypothetical protein